MAPGYQERPAAVEARGCGRAPAGVPETSTVQTPRVVTKSDALDELAAEVRAAGRLALDTEFVWERTYRPALGVVQIATDRSVPVIDALAVRDLAPLYPVLVDPAVPVVLHGGGQDLDIFAGLMGAPVRGVVDTQV